MGLPAVLGGVILSSLAWTVSATETEAVDFRGYSPDAVENQTTALVGVVYPRGRYALALEVSGVVNQAHVSEGDRVEAGSPLISLEQTLETLQLERLALDWKDTAALDAKREQLQLLEERLKTSEQLFAEAGSISRDEIRLLEVQRISLRAEVNQLEVIEQREALDHQIGAGQLALRTLHAPVSGVISQVTVKPGEWVQSGAPVVELIDSAVNFVRLTVPSTWASRLDLGAAASVEIEGERREGRIQYIAPIADPASGQVEVKVEFANPDFSIRPGLSARVLFATTP